RLAPHHRATLPLAMADEPITPELDWIETCARDVAEEARDILSDVLREMDLVLDPQVISPYPRGTSDLKWSANYHEEMATIRTRVAEMLVKRHVLRSAQPFHERSPYVSDEQREGLR